MNYDPSLFYQEELRRTKPLLEYDPAQDFAAWRERVREKFTELLRRPGVRTRPEMIVEYTDDSDPRFDETRFSFESEPGYFVPCHLLIPKGAEKPPVMICIQGHSTGMHNSLGRAKYDGDEESISGGDRDFGIQAVKNGYAALVMEQRNFGECEENQTAQPYGRCHQPSFQALLLGRTMIGDRSFDVSRAIDVLETLDCVDAADVSLMGNSGGGTVTYYTACAEPRLSAFIPSCSVCTVHASIFSLYHCQCNYIPRMLEYFEMADLACLIAPRPMVVVAGREDEIFPYDDVKKAFARISEIYAAAGAPGKCVLVTGEGGHRFYADQGWKAFNEIK